MGELLEIPGATELFQQQQVTFFFLRAFFVLSPPQTLGLLFQAASQGQMKTSLNLFFVCKWNNVVRLTVMESSSTAALDVPEPRECVSNEEQA